MKKNFLLVFLLALLPMVGWSQDVMYSVDEADAVAEPGILTLGENGVSVQLLISNDQGVNPPVYQQDRRYWEWQKLDGDNWTNFGDANANPLTITDAGTYRVLYHYGYTSINTVNGAAFEVKAADDDTSTDPTYKEVQVEFITGVTMPYGGEIKMTPDNAINVISLVGLELNTQEDALKKEIIKKLRVENAEALKKCHVGETPAYYLGLKYKSQAEVDAAIAAGEEDANYGTYNTVVYDGVTYKISPLHVGYVTIVKGLNEFVTDEDGEYLFGLKKDLPYNGAAQDLLDVPEVPEGEEAPELATLGGVQFFAMSYEDYDALENAPDPAQYGSEIKETDWSDAYPVGKPEGTEVGRYYVWARTTSTTDYDGQGPVWIDDYAEIVKATPVIAGDITGVDAKYYLKTTPGNMWNNLYRPNNAAIEPGGSFTASYQQGAVEPVEATGWAVEEATYKDDGTVAKDDKGNIIWSGQVNWLNGYQFHVGTFRMKGRFYGINDESEIYQNVGSLESEPFFIFEVVNPTYTVTTTPASTVISYSAQDQIPFSYNVTWEGYEPTFNPAPATPETANYIWYDQNGEPVDTPVEAGSYTVQVEDQFNDASFDFIENFVAAQVTVTAGQIFAKIEDKTLKFGQTLPLQMTYDDGAIAPTNTEAIEAFNDIIWSEGFKATLIKDAEGKDVTDAEPIDLKAEIRTSWVLGVRVTTIRTTILPVGTYKVKAEPGGDDTNLIMTNTATWTVTPKNFDNEDIAILYPATTPSVAGLDNFRLTAKTYTSEEIELTQDDLAGKFTYRTDARADEFNYGALVLDKDYEITGYENNINAGTATFTVKGINNFTGEKDLTFPIAKAKLYVYPAEGATWKLNSVEPNDTYAINWGDNEDPVDPTSIKDQLRFGNDLNGPFKNDKNDQLDLTTENGFKDLAVKRIVGSDVTDYPEGVIAYLPEGAAPADNYDFIFMKAPLSVQKGLIQLQLAAQETEYSGSEKPGYTPAFELANGDELSPILAENWEKVVNIDWSKITVTDNLDSKKEKISDDPEVYRYPAGDYEMTIAEIGEGAFTSTNYEFEVVEPLTAALTVTPVEIELVAVNHQHTFEAFSSNEEILAERTAINNGNINVIPGLKPGDVLTDVVDHIAISDYTTAEDAEGRPVLAYEITIVPVTNPNYVITLTAGQLNVYPNEGIVLYSEADEFTEDAYGNKTLTGGDWLKLIENDGKAVNGVTVYIKQPSIILNGEEKPIEWIADRWYSLCLPFDVQVRDVAAAFGYGIVNIVDPERVYENDVHFKLQNITETIYAHTPFTVKSDVDLDLTAVDAEGHEGYVAYFPGIHIISLPEAKQVSYEFENDFGYTFDGTYEAMTIDKNKSYLRFLYGEKWAGFGPSSPNSYNMQPYTGYVNLGASAGARNVTFHFEEADGTITSIDAVDFMNGNAKANAEGIYNLNGMKLQGAPTQKGVYIQKGQKMIIK